MSGRTALHCKWAGTQHFLSLRRLGCWSQSLLSTWSLFGSLATDRMRRLWSDCTDMQGDLSFRWAWRKWCDMAQIIFPCYLTISVLLSGLWRPIFSSVHSKTFFPARKVQGTVVQSIFSLKSLLMTKSLTVLAKVFSNTLIRLLQ